MGALLVQIACSGTAFWTFYENSFIEQRTHPFMTLLHIRPFTVYMTIALCLRCSKAALLLTPEDRVDGVLFARLFSSWAWCIIFIQPQLHLLFYMPLFLAVREVELYTGTDYTYYYIQRFYTLSTSSTSTHSLSGLWLFSAVSKYLEAKT
jgi:hypothetical protein